MNAVAPQVAVANPAWTTPQILRAEVLAIWIASALLMAAAIAGAQSHRHAMQVVGKDSAPSIIAAEHIRAELAAMDGEAANELLLRSGSVDAFEARQNEAAAAIVGAAENITYGEWERQPIQRLAVGVGTYAAGVQRARDKLEAGDKGYLAAWRKAADFMDARLLPASTDLDTVNRNELDKTYAQQRSASVQASVLLILGGVLLGGVLISVQIFLAGRMRRILNPLLVVATLGTLVFLIYAGQRFAASDRDLKVAKEDAFESIHALWQARAVSYAANGDEIRYLLDPATAAKYEQDFRSKADQVDGFLTKELNNITFPGEEEAAKETAARFHEYRQLDGQLRELEKSGRHDAAVTFWQKQSNEVFQRFDGALGRTLKVNQDAFESSVASGFRDVNGFEITAPVAALLIALLGWLGMRPRMREYSV